MTAPKCERGQAIQDAFDKAIAKRIAAEHHDAHGLGSKNARVNEAIALRQRVFHVHNCAECWQSPAHPKNAATY